MTYLTKEAVVMGNTAQDKTQALAQVAECLAKQGLVAGDYTTALSNRESQANTYLGQGIAIPHGTLSDKDKVVKTGVTLVHFADGVDWGGGQMVHLAVGIAAKDDEHLNILRQLARALDNDDVGDALKNAKTPDDILRALGQKVVAPKEHAITPYIIETKARDVESLLVFACEFLSQKKAVDSGFLSSLLAKPVINLGQGIGFVQSDSFVKKPTLLAINLIEALVHNNQNLGQVIVMATNQSVDVGYVASVVDGVMNNPPTSREDWQRILGQDNGNYQSASVVLANRQGLHARPATVLSNVASKFDDEIEVSIDNEHFVSAKSLVRLLSLGASFGETLYFRTPSTMGAGDRLLSMIEAVKDGLGEEVVAVVANTPKDDTYVTVVEEPKLNKDEPYRGMIASQGLCVAPAYVVKEREFEFERLAQDPQKEKRLLDMALMVVHNDLATVISNAKTLEIAEIFTAHQHLLDDGEILAGVHKRIDSGLSAPMAWHSEIGELSEAQSKVDNPLLAQRAMDLKDIGRRVLATLCGESVSVPKGEYVLIKDDLLPSDVATLGDDVSAIVTAFGGVNSHSAIIARSLGIPALVGVGSRVLDVAQGETILVNAQEGYFIIAPNETLTKETADRQTRLKYEQNLAKIHAHETAKTTDGHRVEVVVNLGDVAGAGKALELGAEGVGLLRTEFVFMKHASMPSIDTQKADYQEVFDTMAGRPVVVRTLDVGGDKPLPYLAMNKEDNPFLGVRGVRLTLTKPNIFKDQLTALIQASNESAQSTGKPQDLRIMFPMIGRLEEWRACRAILDEVLADNPHPNLQVGMMIEVPSAVALSDKFAKEVDFFSIGTNDLVQYTLAIDRGHPSLSSHADGLNPAILRLIDQTVKSAHAHGKWVGVCGELASDEMAVPVLLGLGVDELSVSASQIPLVKMKVRTLSLDNCQNLAQTALSLDTASDVRALVAKTVTQAVSQKES